MPFVVPIADAQRDYPEYTFVAALSASEQKAAFHVQSKTGEDLCLKIIAPSYQVERLNREILALQKLSHPNVVRLLEYTFSTATGKQRHYMIEEFIAGKDLADLIVAGAPWSRKEVASAFAALAGGLGALGDADIVHRDLKPRNIRVRPDGSPVIIDFGLARHLSLPDLTSTAAGARIGTPLYFAPEQADPAGTKHDIDHRTDLFALGVILYEALLGEHPFLLPGVTSTADLCLAICGSTACLGTPGFRALPAEWRIVISKLLEKERARRPKEAKQVAAILAKLGAK